MISGLTYLKRMSENDLHTQGKLLIFKELLLLKHEDGKLCDKCNIAQGYFYKGFEKYYCKHFRTKIERKIKKEEEKIKKSLIDFVKLSLSEDVQVKV